LDPPSNNEILNLITSLKDNKTVGHDNIPAFYVKLARYIITPYFKLFLNFVFEHDTFSESCKIARVILIYKSGKGTKQQIIVQSQY